MITHKATWGADAVRDVGLRVIANQKVVIAKPNMGTMDAVTFRLTGVVNGGLANSAAYPVSTGSYFKTQQGWAGNDFFFMMT
jgi:hypothetical protein